MKVGKRLEKLISDDRGRGKERQQKRAEQADFKLSVDPQKPVPTGVPDKRGWCVQTYFLVLFVCLFVWISGVCVYVTEEQRRWKEDPKINDRA